MADDTIDVSQWLPRRAPRVNPFRQAKGDLVAEATTGGGALIRSFAWPLDYILHRGSVEPRQHDAGSELHRLWYHGCLASKHAQTRYGEVRSASDRELGLELNRRYAKAMMSVRGVPERRVAYAVCCLGESLTGLAGERTVTVRGADSPSVEVVTLAREFKSERTARRKGMERLRSALDDLADHFGY